MIIGITGGTGSGKTTLLKELGRQNALILDCDAIYHELIKTDAALLDQINTEFPGSVTQGVLDRKRLGKIVFSDPAALERLNEITHNAVKKQVLKALQGNPSLAAIDAIALHESGLAELCDVTVAVTAPEAIRVQRLMVRDGISMEAAQMRIRAQKSQEAFSQLCDHTLQNDGTQEAFREKCLAFFRDLGIIKEKTKENSYDK